MTTPLHTDPAPTLDEIWRLFKETDRKFQETDRKFQETDRLLKELAQEAERRSQETDRNFRETYKKIGELGNRLGEFVEGFIKPAVIRLFQERGLDVDKVTRDVEANKPALGLAMQIDLLVVNGDSCILIEVKSHLTLDDVNEHLARMEKFKPLFPEYRDKKIFGAVAGMVIADNVAKYAYRQGFFVIAQKGDTAIILNDMKFQPKAW